MIAIAWLRWHQPRLGFACRRFSRHCYIATAALGPAPAAAFSQDGSPATAPVLRHVWRRRCMRRMPSWRRRLRRDHFLGFMPMLRAKFAGGTASRFRRAATASLRHSAIAATRHTSFRPLAFQRDSHRIDAIMPSIYFGDISGASRGDGGDATQPLRLLIRCRLSSRRSC